MVDDVEYADAGRRFVAYIIDLFAFSVLAGIVGAIFGLVLVAMDSDAEFGDVAYAIAHIISIVAVALYYCISESSDAMASPGKRAMGLQVRREDGTQMSFGRALIRFLCESATAPFLLPLAAIWFTDRRQTLHDILSRTVVVRA